MITVLGGTGQVGSHVSAALAERDDVRAVAHSDRSAQQLAQHGFDVVRADLDRPETLAPAMEGADALFLLTPNDPALAEREIAAVETARHAGVRRLVNVSVIGDETLTLTAPHRQVEQHLAGTDLEWTALRLPSFASNLLGQLEPISQGAFYFAAGDARIPHIDPRDIADVSVALLDGNAAAQGTVLVTGPEPLTFHDVAARISRRTGQQVQYVDPGAEGWGQALRQAGLSDWLADGLVQIFGWYAQVGTTPATDAVDRLAGQPARSLETFLDELLVPALSTTVG